MLLAWILVAIAGAILAVYVLPIVWKAIGAYRIHRAGPRPLAPAQHVIWRDPGNPGGLDLINGPGGADGAPAAPFRFIEEHLSGSQPCVSVFDRHERRWRVKWGEEVRSENFAVRFVWSCGYFAETTYFVASGRIDGARDLSRARLRGAAPRHRRGYPRRRRRVAVQVCGAHPRRPAARRADGERRHRGRSRPVLARDP